MPGSKQPQQPNPVDLLREQPAPADVNQPGGAVPLPHESDQSPESQHEEGERQVGKQAHDDLEHGLVDTDRRGGADYQAQTQNDAQADENSRGAPDTGSPPAKPRQPPRSG